MLRIHTRRLILVAATAELAQAEQTEVKSLGNGLGARVPSDWPPPLNDEQSMNWLVNFLVAHPESAGWALWYFLKTDNDGDLVAIGNGGFKGNPSSDGTIEVGYSIMDKHQRKGYAPEAVDALSTWAFSHSNVRRIIAHTLPHLTPSIRVLEKCDFRFVGDGPEVGVILFERLRQ